MSDEMNRPDQQEQGYTPASPVKRTLAWIALVYVLIFLALTTYFYYTGTMLGNLAPLLVVPGLIGLGILVIVSWKTSGTPGKGPAILLALVCWTIALITLPLGIYGLLSNFSQMGVSIFVSGLGG